MNETNSIDWSRLKEVPLEKSREHSVQKNSHRVIETEIDWTQLQKAAPQTERPPQDLKPASTKPRIDWSQLHRVTE